GAGSGLPATAPQTGSAPTPETAADGGAEPDAEPAAAPRNPMGLALTGLRRVDGAVLGGPRPGFPGVPARAGAGALLAGTGTPVAVGLAGLVLLAVGGLLTWRRARG